MRPSWEQIFVQITELIAKRSTCIRLQVGAIIVKENRIISMGFNGSTSGAEHCCDIFKNVNITSKEFYDDHGKFSIYKEVHAEENAIAFAAKNGMSTNGCNMYVSYTPCINCAKLCLSAGIKSVYYIKPYDRDMSGKTFLEANGIVCEQI